MGGVGAAAGAGALSSSVVAALMALVAGGPVPASVAAAGLFAMIVTAGLALLLDRVLFRRLRAHGAVIECTGEVDYRGKHGSEEPYCKERTSRSGEVQLGSGTEQRQRRVVVKPRGSGSRFDLVYVDGSHRSTDVEADATLSWLMVRHRGIVIFDDYEWSLLPDEVDRPKAGIDGFLSMHADQYRELHRGYQLIVEKVIQI